MKRKYPETDSFIYFNQNPKNKITGDCTFRAISLALEQDYNTTVMEMAAMMCKTGYALDDSKGIDYYLKSKGWVKHSQPRMYDNTKYTGKQFAKWLSINYEEAELGNIIANIGGHHITCFKPTYHEEGFNCRYKIHDIWNCSYKCIGNYWTKERG